MSLENSLIIHLQNIQNSLQIIQNLMSPITTLRAATHIALINLDVRSRKDLNILGGPTNSGLYKIVTGLAPELWATLKVPEASVRALYERILPGYKYYRTV